MNVLKTCTRFLEALGSSGKCFWRVSIWPRHVYFILSPFISSRRYEVHPSKTHKGLSQFFSFFCWRYSLIKILFLQYVSFRATIFDETIIFFKKYIYPTLHEYYSWNDEYFQYSRYVHLYELMLYLCNALSILIAGIVINFYHNAISIIRIEISNT